MGRHIQYADLSVPEFRKRAQLHVEALNHALANIPPEQLRMHVCWGNYEGPHDLDVPLEDIWPVVSQMEVGAVMLSMANPRHAHEYRLFSEPGFLGDKLLIAGVIETTTNYIEHPQVVADRIERIAAAVGDPHRILAGTDCGFETSAGTKMVVPEIVWAKLKSLSDGAAIASRRLMG